MPRLNYLLPFLLLFLYSCEKDRYELNAPEAETSFEMQERGDGSNSCLSITRIGRDQEGCCGFEVCLNGKIDRKATYQIFGAPTLITLTADQPCVTIYSCEFRELTLVKTDDWISQILCTEDLTCVSVEECCESICYDYELLFQDVHCFTFEVTLDGNADCFPNGIPIFEDGPIGSGPIQLVDYSGSNGTVELVSTEDHGYRFKYCRDDLYTDYFFEFTLQNSLCQSTDTYRFDLFGQGPYHKQCPD